MSEEKKESWLKLLAIILAVFIGAFLAFYFAAEVTISRMMDPSYQMKKMEKMIKQNEKSFRHLEDTFIDHPFEPKMSPLLVNLVKEGNEYKVIVNLKPLNGDEKNLDVKLSNNIITVSGKFEQKEHRKEEIMNFSQSYYLDEKLLEDKLTKERKGNKYIITIPFED